MKIAFISDIHGNLEALTTALTDIKRRKITEIYCLGDIVGYGANPERCLELVRLNSTAVVLGNHDAAAVGNQSLAYFNQYARAAALWTQSVLSDKDKQYIRSLPMVAKVGGMHLVHGTPKAPERWDYIFSSYDAQTQFTAIDGDICFVGHSHVPGEYIDRDDIDSEEPKRIINVGSVGQPRDRDPRLCFVVFDDDSRDVEFVRLDYDVDAAAAEIRQAGLPRFLADRLIFGN